MPLPARRKNQSFVLVLVLGMLVLITVLVVGFLGRVISQTKSSSSYRDQTGTLLLSDVAVSIVKSQIDAATAVASTSPPGLWASQPGAIRTIASSGTQTTYKLYSSTNLLNTDTGPTLKADLQADLPTAADANDWNSSGLWTDLNAPIVKSNGMNAYPIVDVFNDNGDLPAAAGTTTAPFTSGSFNIDSTAANNPIGASRLATAKSPLPSNAPLPMPVRWLYVLKQGQVIAPDSTSTATSLTFNNASTKPASTPNNPATDNPIVGRVAFWTDDDTCRVNINTASYGTFWDTPKFSSLDDYAFANNQPVRNEFQRTPGHAGMTTLSLALPEKEFTNSATAPETLIGLTPRYNQGGTKENTVQTFSAIGIPARTTRFYDSVNELIFDPPPTSSGARAISAYLTPKQVETSKFFLTAHSRAPELNLFGQPRVSMWPISYLANGGGNVYRTPTDQFLALASTLPTGTSYYFTRNPYTPSPGSKSSTADVSLARNVKLLGYLDNLTSQVLPANLSGTSSFDSKYTTLGQRQILTEIFDYIRITNARDPLLGDQGITPGGVPYAAATSINPTSNGTNNGTAGVPGDGQILPTSYGTWGTYGYGRFGGRLVEAALDFVGVGQGISSTATSYIFPPSTSANFNAVPYSQFANGGSYTNSADYSYLRWTNGGVGGFPTTVAHIPLQGDTAVQAMLCLTFYDPALGWSPANPDFYITVSGLSTLKLSGNSLNFSDPASTEITTIIYPTQSMENQIDNERPGDLGSILDFRNTCAARVLNRLSVSRANFPFYSDIVNVPGIVTTPTSSMALSGGGLVTINVYPDSTLTSPIHTYVLDFSKLNGNIPVPAFSHRPMFGTSRTIAPSGGVLANNPPSVPPTPAATGGNTTDRFDNYNTHTEDTSKEQIDFILDSFRDTVISMVPTANYGDYRMLAPYASAIGASSSIQAGTAFQPHSVNSSQTNLAYGFEYSGGQFWHGTAQGTLVNVTPKYWVPAFTDTYNSSSWSSIPLVPETVSNPNSGSSTAPPDFDNGLGDIPDGAYINKPDEGATYPNPNTVGTGGGTAVAYYENRQETSQTMPENFFSPQRQVPSPVMLGSLPTGAPVGTLAAKPWQTLLFQPGAGTGATAHAGLTAPKDEYLLDLFWMPQGEPWAISEPFSTAGKVNLNYQILPFTYIDRSTAIQSVLSTEKVAMVGSTQAGTYKQFGSSFFAQARFALNLSEKDGTLSQFVQRFNNLDFFHAAAEICDIYLVPLGKSWTPDTVTGSPPYTYTDSVAQTAFYGTAFALVGDNTREKPYADIYSRITTKSNSFTVYYRVQALKNPPGGNAAQWTEGQGVILGDYRGSTSLERFLDANDTNIPDYATAAASTANLETHYKWRVVSNSRFAP